MLEIISTIFSIAILELMLSVDNALVNASLAEELPVPQQKKAIYFGIGIGAIFRVICLFFATIIIRNPSVKILGGLYLCYLAYAHFFRADSKEPALLKQHRFGKVIAEIAIADLVFSIDNIVGAVGISSHFSYVVFGVLVGIATMLFITPIMLVLMGRFPSLIKTAYGIIAYVGLSILADAFLRIHIHEYATFGLIVAAVIATMIIDSRRKSNPSH
ncbi:MAG: hypothetical protein JWO73_364 [Candidatus Taylorbacteria bacterium]|nr:hypothetical protein [Candidatus Taylorbacteria bacterium]